MSTEGKGPKKSSRRDFAKLIAAAGATLPLMSLNVEGQTRKQKKKFPWQNKQTSPITVGGGGSVTISFNHKHYKGANGKYSHSTDEVLATQIFDRFDSLKWELTPLTKDVNCKITVHTTKKDGSNPKDIIIRSKPGGPFSIEFDETLFPLKAGEKQLHYQEDRKIVDFIELLNNDDQLQATLTPPSAGVCKIHLLNTNDKD